MKKPTYEDLERRILQLENELAKNRRNTLNKKKENKTGDTLFPGDIKADRTSLEDDHDKFRTFFDNLTEAISLHKMITDNEGKIIDFTYEDLNPARERMINFTYQEVKDMTVRQVNPDIEDGFMEKYGQVAITGNPLSFEYYSKTFNRHLKVKAFSPRYSYVATIIDDVTEQKRGEAVLARTMEKYRTIFENSVEGIILVDDTGTITEWNKFIEQKTGFTKSKTIGAKIWDVQYSLLTKDWKKKYPGDSLREIWLTLIDTIPENEIITKEGQFLDQDGRLVLTEDLLCPIKLNGEKFLCIMQRDLTERRNAEQELKLKEHKLELLNATKDKLFSIIAHDLRSPFNSILGYSQHLRENLRKYSVEESEKYLDIINSAVQNTLNLLINLLSWAKNQTGHTTFTPETLILRKIIEEVADLLNSSAKIKNISLSFNLDDKIRIHADKNMVKTILQNLISNAVKFTNPGGNIFISAIPFSDHVEITVSDNGIGISKKAIKDLFKIVSNISTNGTINESGSGLGLVICREFVERHGGKIWVESKAGKGSDFKFTIPIHV